MILLSPHASCRYKHPLYDREGSVVVGGDYITTETGTGLVHTAPGHGVEDYQVPALAPAAHMPCCTQGG